MKDLDTIMAEHPFFAGLADGARRTLAGCAQMAAYEADELLFQTGKNAEHFFLIRRGRVALELRAPGREVFRFETLGAGEVLGWSWLFEPHRWQFDARALEPTGVVRFDGKCLRGKCDADPQLGYEVVKRFAQVLVRRFSDARLQLIDIYGNNRS